MLTCFLKSTQKNTTPIFLVTQTNYPAWLKQQTLFVKNWLQASSFKNEVGCLRQIPDEKGKLTTIIYILSNEKNFWDVGNLSQILPEGEYHFEGIDKDDERYAIAWGLGAYQFTRYKLPKRAPAKLRLPKKSTSIESTVESIYLVRDLINTPADDLGPSELGEAAAIFARKHKAHITQIVGDALLKKNFPAIHAVGRASDDLPRLIDIRWGNKKHRKVTLVGKGVCFDTGGLDIKPSSGMLLMKKDMAGAAHVLGLAKMIMDAKLPVCLRVLIPAVENSISGNAYRPGDIVKSRKGLTIEVGNTDAEGRVILADAITEAVSEQPDLLIDIASLTGAARVALGTELPALFSNNDTAANAVLRSGQEVSDPAWRLPLFEPYREALNTPFADLTNSPLDPYAGAITAALFLQAFVPSDIPWLHYDLMAWNLRAKPGRPQGGEAMALRGLFQYLSEWSQK